MENNIFDIKLPLIKSYFPELLADSLAGVQPMAKGSFKTRLKFSTGERLYTYKNHHINYTTPMNYDAKPYLTFVVNEEFYHGGEFCKCDYVEFEEFLSYVPEEDHNLIKCIVGGYNE